MYDGWQRRRHRDLIDAARAMRVAHAEKDEIGRVFPPPKPLLRAPDDQLDRSRWW